MLTSFPYLRCGLLQELGRANPRLIQIIQANQEEFLRMLQEEPSQEEMVGGVHGCSGAVEWACYWRDWTAKLHTETNLTLNLKPAAKLQAS